MSRAADAVADSFGVSWAIIGSGSDPGVGGRETERAPACATYQGSTVMATDGECVDYARECVRLAGLTKDLQLRTGMDGCRHARTESAAIRAASARGDRG
jgi:hypothetical protein